MLEQYGFWHCLILKTYSDQLWRQLHSWLFSKHLGTRKTIFLYRFPNQMPPPLHQCPALQPPHTIGTVSISAVASQALCILSIRIIYFSKSLLWINYLITHSYVWISGKMSVVDMHSQDLCSALKAFDSAVIENALFLSLIRLQKGWGGLKV